MRIPLTCHLSPVTSHRSSGPRFQLLGAPTPVLLEVTHRRLTVAAAQGIDHPGMLTSREAHAAGLAYVGVEVPSGSLAQSGNHLEQPRVGAALQQNPVPIVMQVDGSGWVAPSGLHPTIEGSEPFKALTWKIGREPQGQWFESAQDGADIPYLAGIQWAHPEPPSRNGLQGTVPAQPKQCFADGRAADAEPDSQGCIANPATGRKFPSVNEMEYLSADVFAEWGSDDHGALGSASSARGFWCAERMLYTVSQM